MDIITSLKALYKSVDGQQLTSELGGSFPYNHTDWLQFYQVRKHTEQWTEVNILYFVSCLKHFFRQKQLVLVHFRLLYGISSVFVPHGLWHVTELWIHAIFPVWVSVLVNFSCHVLHRKVLQCCNSNLNNVAILVKPFEPLVLG